MTKRTGPVQARILARARRTMFGNVMPAGFLERRACLRLERRCILRRRYGLPGIWTVL